MKTLPILIALSLGCFSASAQAQKPGDKLYLDPPDRVHVW